MLNVLILVDKFDYHGSSINGPARYFSWVASRLDRSRFNPVVCTLRGRGESDIVFQEQEIEVTYLDMGRFDPFTLNRVVRLIRERRIDVLHLTGYGSTTFGRLAGALCRKPTIVHEHWVDPDFKPVHALFERLMNVLPSRAIAISDYARRFLIEKKGVPEDRITVIHNGVPLEQFRNVSAETRLRKREELGITEKQTAIGIVGMLHHNKGHRYFVEAAARVVPRRPKTVFLVIGDGSLRGELTDQVRRLDLEQHLRFLGQRSDMAETLSILDIFVMASISESAGLSLLEAMAAGKPIVTTDCGGPSEVIRDGESGLVVPVQDAVALAERIERLIDEPDLARRLGQRAGEVSDRYDIGRTVSQLQEFYLEAASGSG